MSFKVLNYHLDTIIAKNKMHMLSNVIKTTKANLPILVS